MLFSKPSNVVALASVAVLFTTSTLATPTVLIPCGDGAQSQPHAIVPDAKCQKISDTGAFTISNLDDVESGVKLGFSATPDCQATYVPSRSELVKLQESGTCRVYTVDNANGEKQDDAYKQKMNKRESSNALWHGFLIKRDHGHGGDKGQQQQLAAAAQNGENEGTQAPLTYVMLVNT